MKTLRLACLLIFFLPTVARAGDHLRDGNWWRETSARDHNFYAMGFFDGMDLGSRFSEWEFLESRHRGVCLPEAVDSYKKYFHKYMEKVTSQQLSDGLDSFFLDPKNRSILVPDAIWVVANDIAGTSKKKIDQLIQNSRTEAAKHK